MTKGPLGGKNRTGVSPTDAESGVKRSLLTEGDGVPIGLVAEGANRHAMKLVRATVESLVVERPKPTKTHPQGMCLDAGDDDDEMYTMLPEFDFTAHVRSRREEAKAINQVVCFKARRWVKLAHA